MIKNWFVGINFVDEISISRLGFVAQILNNIEVEHPYLRAQLQENIVTVIKSELTRSSSIIKGEM